MIDLVRLLLKAGDGGDGRVAFRREKYIPKGGPNGGKGGSGGSIIIRATAHKNTLGHLAGVKEIVADRGAGGGKQQMTGRDGEDTVIEVPIGTIIWQVERNAAARRRELKSLSDENVTELRSSLKRGDVRFEIYEVEKETEPAPYREPDSLDVATLSLKNINLAKVQKTALARFDAEGDELLICQGGFGGRGNESFKSSSQTTPMIAEYGTFGEQRLVLIELQLLADVGLVGLPNAGKSTFLKQVSKANPRIANYPFTTLEPQLGIWTNQTAQKQSHGELNLDRTKQRELVVADIPGLIEGANRGQGLGYTFLRHIQACQSLLFFLTPDDATIGDLQSGALSVAQVIDQLESQYAVLLRELAAFNEALLAKKRVVCFNKIDLLPADLQAAIESELRARNFDWQLLSALSGQGVAEVHKQLSVA